MRSYTNDMANINTSSFKIKSFVENGLIYDSVLRLFTQSHGDHLC